MSSWEYERPNPRQFELTADIRLPVSVRQLGSFIAAVAGGFEFWGVAAQPNRTSPETMTPAIRIVALIDDLLPWHHSTSTPRLNEMTTNSCYCAAVKVNSNHSAVFKIIRAAQ